MVKFVTVMTVLAAVSGAHAAKAKAAADNVAPPTPKPTTKLNCTKILGPFDQCGGNGFVLGKRACAVGYECVENDPYYSQCLAVPVAPGDIAAYGICGGSNFSGTGKCTVGTTCTVIDEYTSQCTIDSLECSDDYVAIDTPQAGCVRKIPGYAQCGGIGFDAQGRMCQDGFACVMDMINGLPNEYFSQCKPKKVQRRTRGFYQVCGGASYQGAITKCTLGSTCKPLDQYTSQCAIDVPQCMPAAPAVPAAPAAPAASAAGP